MFNVKDFNITVIVLYHELTNTNLNVSFYILYAENIQKEDVLALKRKYFTHSSLKSTIRFSNLDIQVILINPMMSNS